ncbi:MAG TPA: hypothetical protein VGH27_30800 [Streptosporangiaceae bacterium]
MVITISLVFVLGAAVWVLHKYAGLKVWHGVLCVLFGFYLATSSLAPDIRTTVTAIIHALTGQG